MVGSTEAIMDGEIQTSLRPKNAPWNKGRKPAESSAVALFRYNPRREFVADRNGLKSTIV